MNKSNELLKELNPEQINAVTHYEGPMLVLSGAGSGKTRVITHRAAYLIDHYGVQPSNILGLTFTNKAAEEMNERLENLLPRQLSGNSPWLGTFHALGAQLLRDLVEELDKGYDRYFTIFDQSDQKEAIKETMVELDISTEEFQPGVIASLINDAKNVLIAPNQFRSKKAGEIDDYTLRVVSRVYNSYQEKLEEWNGLDFGDLIRLPTVLLDKGLESVQAWKDRFKFLLVDEYQDTNHAQYVLASQLAAPENNICVVGDDDQAIFGWRGADVSNLLEFEEDYPDAKVVHLSKNYRSKKPILRAANAIIKNNKLRKQKKMEPERGEGESITVYNASDEEDEAEFLVSQINKLRKNGVKLGEIAVLYRVNPLSRGIEKKLVKNNVPYEIVRGTRFYERREVKDVLAYLRVVCNPHDDLHLLRIINTPRRGIGSKTQETIKRSARRQGISVWDVLTEEEKSTELSSRQESSLEAFLETVEGLRNRRGEQDLVDYVKQVVSEIGYFSFLEKEYDPESSEDRRNNVRELIGQIKESENDRLEGFLENVALESDVDSYEDQRNKVSLLTLHSAKGLEFGYVFLIAMEDGLLPHKRSLEEQRMEEERRLCYVGLTRAKNRVFLSYTDSRFLYGQKFSHLPSRFLEEIPDEEKKYVEEKSSVLSSERGGSRSSSAGGDGWKDFIE